jgi:hypothetical protein
MVPLWLWSALVMVDDRHFNAIADVVKAGLDGVSAMFGPVLQLVDR